MNIDIYGNYLIAAGVLLWWLLAAGTGVVGAALLGKAESPAPAALQSAKLREKLADQEHDRWSRWMRYLLTKGVFNPDGSFTINAESVARWQRQMETPYSDLSETEKDSDRKEADQVVILLGEFKL